METPKKAPDTRPAQQIYRGLLTPQTLAYNRSSHWQQNHGSSNKKNAQRKLPFPIRKNVLPSGTDTQKKQIFAKNNAEIADCSEMKVAHAEESAVHSKYLPETPSKNDANADFMKTPVKRYKLDISSPYGSHDRSPRKKLSSDVTQQMATPNTSAAIVRRLIAASQEEHLIEQSDDDVVAASIAASVQNASSSATLSTPIKIHSSHVTPQKHDADDMLAYINPATAFLAFSDTKIIQNRRLNLAHCDLTLSEKMHLIAERAKLSDSTSHFDRPMFTAKKLSFHSPQRRKAVISSPKIALAVAALSNDKHSDVTATNTVKKIPEAVSRLF